MINSRTKIVYNSAALLPPPPESILGNIGEPLKHGYQEDFGEEVQNGQDDTDLEQHDVEQTEVEQLAAGLPLASTSIGEEHSDVSR